MFKNMSIAEFSVEDHKAYFIIDRDAPIAAAQSVLNKLMHYCVERLKEAENEEAQRLKDEEASKPPELEAEEAPIEGSNCPEQEAVPNTEE